MSSALSLTLSLSLSDFLYTSLSLSLSPPNSPSFVFCSLCLLCPSNGNTIIFALYAKLSLGEFNSSLLMFNSLCLYISFRTLTIPPSLSLSCLFLPWCYQSFQESQLNMQTYPQVTSTLLFLCSSLPLSIFISSSLSPFPSPSIVSANPHCISFVNEEQQLSQSQALHKVLLTVRIRNFQHQCENVKCEYLQRICIITYTHSHADE